jgi:mannose-6-phosphate isomerase-like protein (cupin superfamily)
MLNKCSRLALSCLLAWCGLGVANKAHAADDVKVVSPGDLPFIRASEGVRLKELTGLSAPAGARSSLGSVALFELDPGRASAWSHNKIGEESFFILEGHGEVWTGSTAHPVGPGDYILVPPSVVRSIRASKGELLKFYAVTTPSWSKDDDVLVPAPVGAPK